MEEILGHLESKKFLWFHHLLEMVNDCKYSSCRERVSVKT